MAAIKSRWWALIALALATLAIGLDATVLSVALPTLARDLDASTGDLQWFTNAYLLVMAAALLPAGMLGDRFGRKRMLLGALVLFGVASAACAYATSTGQLIAARALLGLGAAVLMPLTAAVLTVLFTPEERPRALTVWVTANALGIPLGPLVGGWLLDNFWWGSVFLINLPLVAVALLAVGRLVPESRGDQRRRFDFAGVVLSTVGLVTLTYGVIEAGERGWGDARSLLMMVAGAVVLVAFGLWQRRARQPLVDLDLFGSRGFTWGAILATVATFTMFGLLFTLPQFFGTVYGTDAFGTGLRLLPVIGGLMVGARLAGRVVERAGAKVVVAAGLAVMAAALAAGATTGAGTGYGYVAVWVSAAGLGLGFAMPPAMNAALGALEPGRSGVGSGLIQAMRQVGSAIGVAVLGTVLNAAYRDALPAGTEEAVRRSATGGVEVAGQVGSSTLLDAVRTAFVHGMDATLALSAALAAAGAVLALVFLPARSATHAPRDGEPAREPAESMV